MSIRVLVADDHRIMREGLRSLLEDRPDIEVIAEAADGRRTVQLARELSPDVVIMDVAMPDLNGIGATRQIIAELPGVKVVALSMHSDTRFVTGMLKAGASGYLLKDCAFEEVARAIKAVAADQTYLSPGIVGIVIDDYVDRLRKTDSLTLSTLMPREVEVLQLLVEGRSTQQIASHLQLSAITIETHLRQIINKLDVHSVAELTKYAIREGLVTVER